MNIDWNKIPLKNYDDLSENEKYELFSYSTKSYFEEQKYINLLTCIINKMSSFLIEIPNIEQCDLIINDYTKFIKEELLKELIEP